MTACNRQATPLHACAGPLPPARRRCSANRRTPCSLSFGEASAMYRSDMEATNCLSFESWAMRGSAGATVTVQEDWAFDGLLSSDDEQEAEAPRMHARALPDGYTRSSVTRPSGRTDLVVHHSRRQAGSMSCPIACGNPLLIKQHTNRQAVRSPPSPDTQDLE